ncbi:MAG: hypothetical protein AMXMBFR84_19540 [Candidatus Hydrogenedentota bacterium]
MRPLTRFAAVLGLSALCVVSAARAEHEVQSELIFPLQGKHVHGSSIVQCPNGDFLAAWFQGSGERSADDVVINGARLKKGAKEWSPVFLMADTPNIPDCNPVLFIDPSEKLWLFYLPVISNRWENGMLKYRTSTNYQGKGAPKWDWQDVIVLTPGEEFATQIETLFEGLNPADGMWGEYAPSYSSMIVDAAKDKRKRQTGWMTRIHPVVLDSGRILLPLYSDGFNISLAAYSDDMGATWTASGPIVGLGPIQPTFVQKKDGTIVGYFRDSGMAPSRAMTSTSSDNGATWVPCKDTEIPNPSSSLEVIKLKDGRWVMICNDTERGRHQICLMMSDNEGATWKWKRYVDKSENNEAGSYAYPSLIQSKDGMLHMTYSFRTNEASGKSIKHVAVHPDWITEGQ